MIITITKAQAIKAVMTEPLKANFFYHNKSEYGDRVDDGVCSVCAVGAIIRSTKTDKLKLNHQVSELLMKGDHRVSVSGMGYKTSSYEYVLESGNYLAALSQYFEFMSGAPGVTMDQIRLALHDFIVAEFPAKFQLEVG